MYFIYTPLEYIWNIISLNHPEIISFWISGNSFISDHKTSSWFSWSCLDSQNNKLDELIGLCHSMLTSPLLVSHWIKVVCVSVYFPTVSFLTRELFSLYFFLTSPLNAAYLNDILKVIKTIMNTFFEPHNLSNLLNTIDGHFIHGCLSLEVFFWAKNMLRKQKILK